MTKTENKFIASKSFDWKESDEATQWIMKQQNKKRVKVYEFEDSEDDSSAFIAIKGNLSKILKENDIYGFEEAKASDFKRVA